MKALRYWRLTDEYVQWDVAPYLVGIGTTPIIFWPASDSLPLTISCVGIAGGGTEALDLGHIELNIEPNYWNGITRLVGSTGPDGEFAIAFRVTPVGDHPRGVPIYLDPDMSPPINVRIDEERSSLHWDYEPEADEEPIDGFRVYLSGKSAMD